jgi:hypothetical protein
MGRLDRILRMIAGLALLAVPFLSTFSALTITAFIAGAVLAGTAAVGTCPIYTLFGWNTCRIGASE